MKEENIKILEMLTEETIDSDEAINLLKALNVNTEKTDHFERDFSDEFNKTFKRIEPELNCMTKAILEEIASVLNKVSHSLKNKKI